MVSVHGTPLEGGCGEAWIRGWYEICRHLPGAWGCDCDLVVLDQPLEMDDGAIWSGLYNAHQNLITVAVDPNPYDSLATILHEIAHFAANPRHRRHHGYSWRRAYAELVADLTGEAILPLASAFHRRARRVGRPVSRRAALDITAIHVITDARPRIRLRSGVVSAVVRGKIHRSPWPRRDPSPTRA